MAPERPQSVLPITVEVSGCQAARARRERLGTRSPPALSPASAWDFHSKGIQGRLDKGEQTEAGTVRPGLCTKAEPSGPGQGLPCPGSHQPRLTMRLAAEEGPNIRASPALPGEGLGPSLGAASGCRWMPGPSAWCAGQSGGCCPLTGLPPLAQTHRCLQPHRSPSSPFLAPAGPVDGSMDLATGGLSGSACPRQPGPEP